MDQKNSENFPDLKFNAPSYSDWLEAGRQELDGIDPIEKLTISKGSLKIKPYYLEPPLEDIGDFALKPAVNPYYGARSWMNTPRIVIKDEKRANELALQYLNSGADGILFEPHKANIQLNVLLNRIKPEFCSLSFLIRNNFSQTDVDINAWIEKEKISDTINGNFYWETLPIADFKKILSTHSQNYSYLGVLVHPETNAEDELVKALEKSVNLLDQLTNQRISVDEIIHNFSFSLSVGTDFFLAIAKVKSLRNLWYQIQGAYGVTKIKPVHIHVTSPAWVSEKFQPHGNLIKSTTAALAAIMGGCDSLTIEPEDQDSEMMSRVARNVSSILREESHLSRVADPTAGSYYLDSLTTELSEKAWQKFQSKMAI
jgi:methylmalonyl-CoA mutase